MLASEMLFLKLFDLKFLMSYSFVRFGSSCQHRCKETRINSDDEACRGRQFCLRDPYGCSCAAGFSGVKCINGTMLDNIRTVKLTPI